MIEEGVRPRGTGRQRRAGVDAQDLGVRDRRPDEEHVVSAGQAVVHDVFGIDPATGQKARVLGPQDARAQDAHRRSAPLEPGTRPSRKAAACRTAVLLVTPGDRAGRLTAERGYAPQT